MYSSTTEFIDCYINDKINEYNTKLMSEYIDYNFECKYYYNENININIKYVNGCFYLIKNCKCEDNVHY